LDYNKNFRYLLLSPRATKLPEGYDIYRFLPVRTYVCTYVCMYVWSCIVIALATLFLERFWRNFTQVFGMARPRTKSRFMKLRQMSRSLLLFLENPLENPCYRSSYIPIAHNYQVEGICIVCNIILFFLRIFHDHLPSDLKLVYLCEIRMCVCTCTCVLNLTVHCYLCKSTVLILYSFCVCWHFTSTQLCTQYEWFSVWAPLHFFCLSSTSIYYLLSAKLSSPRSMLWMFRKTYYTQLSHQRWRSYIIGVAVM
jgi:hypothetical protein